MYSKDTLSLNYFYYKPPFIIKTLVMTLIKRCVSFPTLSWAVLASSSVENKDKNGFPSSAILY